MDPDTPENLLARLSEFVAQTMGWDFPPSRHADLRRGIAAAAKDLGFDSAAACAQQCLAGALTKAQLDRLASHLTVGETYFFRESKTFEVLANEILPSLIRSRRGENRELRIWSAGCCTGEEPYSIAILLRQMLMDWQEWKITLLATDINPLFLRKAEAGMFGQWSFRGAPAWLKERYFRSGPGERFEILPEIRQMVRFSQLNLAAENYAPVLGDCAAMDVIFCRNVLMYFRSSHAARVVEKLHQAQAERGWLIVSSSELSHHLFAPYCTTNLNGAILYQKDSNRPKISIPSPNIPAVRWDEGLEEIPLPDAGFLFVPPPEPLPVCAESEPDNESSALSVEARTLANQGNLAEALGCCDRWIAADKLNPASHYLRSVVLQEQGALLEAVQSLRRALYLDPDHVLAHFALGSIARGRHELRESRRHLVNALRLLKTYPPQTVLPESDGVTAGRLAEMIGSLTEAEVAA
ncbi:MAG TPA: CheR family methyltransferase [Tepidisphaeraceae bacterium]|jgi:chemotaxis protein methyltransferase CheR|nr:CheR family methyltransferase [Tepidisphaeraceae bacterium]